MSLLLKLEDIFKPANPDEIKSRKIEYKKNPVPDSYVEHLFSEDSDISNSEIRLTGDEKDKFEKEENKTYYNISGGHGSGDWAKIVIIDYDDPIIKFNYAYGNDMDGWKQEGSGTYNREKGLFVYDD